MQTQIIFNENYFSNSTNEKNFNSKITNIFDESVKITSLHFDSYKKIFKIKAFAKEKNIFENKFGIIFFNGIGKTHKFHVKNEFQNFGEKLINGEKKYFTEIEMSLIEEENKKSKNSFENVPKIHDIFKNAFLDSFEFYEKKIPEIFEISLNAEWIQENSGIFEIFDEITKNFQSKKIQTCNENFKNFTFSVDSSGYEVLEAKIKNDEIYDKMNLYPKKFLIKTNDGNVEEIPIFWLNGDLIISFDFEQKKKEKLTIKVKSEKFLNTEKYNFIKKTVEKINNEFSLINLKNKKILDNKIYEKNEFNETEIKFDEIKNNKKLLKYKIVNIELLKTFNKNDFEFFEKKENINEILNLISKIFLNIISENTPKISFKIPLEKAMELKINDYVKFNLKNENLNGDIFLKIVNIEFIMKNEKQFAKIIAEIKNESFDLIKELSQKLIKKIEKENYKETPFDKNIFSRSDFVTDVTVENSGMEQMKKILNNEFENLNDIKNFINKNETKISINLLDLRNQKPIEKFLITSEED